MNIDDLHNPQIGFIEKLKHIIYASIEYGKSNYDYVKIGIQFNASTHPTIRTFVSKTIYDMQQLFEHWLSQDKTYQHIKNKTSICRYLADVMTYHTYYSPAQKTIEELESDLLIFIKLLEGGITHV